MTKISKILFYCTLIIIPFVCIIITIILNYEELNSIFLSIITGLLTSTVVSLFFEIKSNSKQRQNLKKKLNNLSCEIFEYLNKNEFLISINCVIAKVKILSKNTKINKMNSNIFFENLKKKDFDLYSSTEQEELYNFFNFHAYSIYPILYKINDFYKTYEIEIPRSLEIKFSDIEFNKYFSIYNNINSFYIYKTNMDYLKCIDFFSFLISLNNKIETLYNSIEEVISK